MKTVPECIACFINQTITASNMANADAKQKNLITKLVMEKLAKSDFSKTPPELAVNIYESIEEITGNSDPYHELKNYYNQMALNMEEYCQNLITNSKTPLRTAVKMAIAGNIIDFGIHGLHNEKPDIDSILEEALRMEPVIDEFETFKSQLDNAKNILYLGDNAGEIVFDKLLIQAIGPERVTFVVRGNPIINDITLADAELVGLDKTVTVISNGFNAPGTILEKCSQELNEAFNAADLIISKGQGNFETLHDKKDPRIFFLLRAKCAQVVKFIKCQLGDIVLVRGDHNH
jgi:uncharacterized protein with ATP-grasp and redox domains